MPTRKNNASTGRRRLGRGLGSLISDPVRIDAPPSDPPKSGPMQGGIIEPKDGTRADLIDQQSARTGDQSPPATRSEAAGAETNHDGQSVQMIELGHIRPGSHQPRQEFDEAALAELAASIRTAGLMQPILVRPAPRPGGGPDAGARTFELVAGERRWRAAQLIELDRIPCLVREMDEQTACECALIENLQREDLNPIERAEAFQRLIGEFALSHQELAERVGLDRSTVSNVVRLNELATSIKRAIAQGDLSLGHAKALLSIASLDDRSRLAEQSMRSGWSVREMERRARQSTAKSPADSPAPGAAAPTREQVILEDLAGQLGDHLGTKVNIQPGRQKGSGKLTIEFYSLDQFEGLMQRMQFTPQ